MLDRLEVALELGDEGAVGPAGEHLGDERAAGLEHLDRKFQRRLDQPHRAQMIGLGVADGVCRHVAQHQVGRDIAKRLAQRLGRGFVHEVHFEDLDPVDRLGREQVDSRNPGLGRDSPHDLRPAAGRNAEVDHRGDALEQAEALVQLDQFIGRAAAVAVGLGALDVRVVELALEPAGRAGLAAAGGLDSGHI